jgi:hypothetical protein
MARGLGAASGTSISSPKLAAASSSLSESWSASREALEGEEPGDGERWMGEGERCVGPAGEETGSPSASASEDSSDEWTVSADFILEVGAGGACFFACRDVDVEVDVEEAFGCVEARRSSRTVGVAWAFFAVAFRERRGSAPPALRF